MDQTNTDRSRILLPALALGLTTAAFIIAKTGRDALFFQGSGGLLQLPLVYINIGVASLPLALIFVKAMKIWGARPALRSCKPEIMCCCWPSSCSFPPCSGLSLQAYGFWQVTSSKKPKKTLPPEVSVR